MTVPGSAAGWCDALEAWGSKSMASVLAPAIDLAEKGFPVSPITAELWKNVAYQLKRNEFGQDLLIDGKAPEPGQVFRNKKLASVLRTLAEGGKAAFYEGLPGQAICEAVKRFVEDMIVVCSAPPLHCLSTLSSVKEDALVWKT